MTEYQWDKLLKIKTSGRDDSNSDTYNYPYEPTPYSVLERLADSGFIRKGDVLLDYGCGKGRVEFFLSYQNRAQTIGIEYDERMYGKAILNRQTSVSGEKTEFVHLNAKEYIVPKEVNRFYFFNPFSIEILKCVLNQIFNSYYENPRECYLFFYYPSDEYVGHLMTLENLDFVDEIDCRDLFPGNENREVILVFRIE